MHKLAFVLFVLTSVTTFSQDLPLAFLQNFDGKSTSYSTEGANDNLIYLKGGRYHIDRKKTDEATTYYWGNPMISFDKDYDVEALMKLEGGAEDYGYGIGFAAKDINNSYAFKISGNGYINVGGYKEGNFVEITGWKKLDAGVIRPTGQDNLLHIKRRGSKLTFYVNKVSVHEMDAPESFGTWTAVLASHAMHISTDYIQFFQKVDNIDLIDNPVKGYVKENLGPNVNSATDEHMPIISADGNILLFTRKKHPQNDDPNYEDIWVTVKDNNNEWIPAVRFGLPINNDGHNSACYYSPDGNYMLVTNVYEPSGNHIAGNGVSLAVKPDNRWRVPQEVKIKKFKHKKGGFYNFTLSATGNELLMSIENSSGLGGNDLFVSFREGDSFSEPINLGSVLNTKDDEAAPFLSPDGVTLYFASRGLPGYGGDDIYVTKRLDDTWTNWSKPKNLGPEINTIRHDVDFKIDAKGEYAYLVSTEDSYGVKPEPLVLITGKVYNAETKQPLGANIEYSDLATNKQIGYTISTSHDGVYRIALPKGKFYSFFATSDKFYSVAENIDLTKLDQYKEIQKDLYLSPIKEGQAVRLNNVFFDFNKATLKDESKAELDRLYDVLLNNKSIKMEISGHTDNVGEKTYNQTLSENRARAVVEYLVQKGIEAPRLTSAGFGDKNPVAQNTTEEGKQLNRRVEFKVTKMR
jgi:outer membrane protein OmpA-like peptidoglycan-associated protein